MKKTLALLCALCLIFLSAALTGCTLPELPSHVDTEDFEDVETLARAAAISYRMLAGNEIIATDTPEFAWNTAGWYAAFTALAEEKSDAVLTEGTLQEIQKIFLYGETYAAPPESLGITSEEIDGVTCWSFPQFLTDLDSYLGYNASMTCEKSAALSYTVTVREYLRFDAAEDTVFSIEFREADDGLRLSLLVRSEYHELDFNAEMLYDANLLSNLLDIYGTLRLTEDFASGFGANTYIGRTEFDYILWTDVSSTAYFGPIQCYSHPTASDRYLAMPVDDTSACLEEYISNTYLPEAGAQWNRLSYTEEEEAFFVESGDTTNVYTVDRGTLAIKEIESFDAADQSIYMMQFHYGDAQELPEPLLSCRTEPRSVTVHMVYEDGASITETWHMPENWELDFEQYCPWGTPYLDEEGTEPYAYPGNGEDYEVWVIAESVG